MTKMSETPVVRKWPRWTWLHSTVVAFLGLWLLFFWVIPEAGHRTLMRDDYYGLGRSAVFLPENISCEEFKGERTEGVWLGIYPYEATIASSCMHDKEKGLIIISVRKPYTFFRTSMEVSGVKKFETEFYQIYDLNWAP